MVDQIVFMTSSTIIGRGDYVNRHSARQAVMHNDELLVSDPMSLRATWTQSDRKSRECTKMRCVLAANGIERGIETFIGS